MMDLGLPPVLASPTQAIVGNLWPVDQLTSAICGTLLALALTENGAYFNADERVFRLLRGGKHECVEYVSQRLGFHHEAVSAMQTTALDFTALAHWGSVGIL